MQNRLERSLKALQERGRFRVLTPCQGKDFSSNDYLGLTSSPELVGAVQEALTRGVPIGAGGSRLLRGNHPEHEALEEEASHFFGSESCLFMGGGFAANTAIFSCLPQREDLVIYDEFIHASSREGILMGRAKSVSAPHNNVSAFEECISSWRKKGGKGKIWIAIETIYSMEGDFAPLESFDRLAQSSDAMLILDEAHATGIFGPKGEGLGSSLEGRNYVLSVHTCGKALGLMGALISAPQIMRDYLINRAKPFIYATAPPPLMAAAVRHALKMSARSSEKRSQLFERIHLFKMGLERQCGLKGTDSQIQPIIIKSDARTLNLAKKLQNMGFDIRAIRPPTVPEGTARLRVSLTLNVTDEDTTDLVEVLKQELKSINQ